MYVKILCLEKSGSVILQKASKTFKTEFASCSYSMSTVDWVKAFSYIPPPQDLG